MLKLSEQSKSARPRVIAEKYLRLCNKFMNEPLENLSISEFGFMQQYRQDVSDIINCLQLFLLYD